MLGLGVFRLFFLRWKVHYEQDWLHNLQGLVQNKNVGPFINNNFNMATAEC